LWVVLTGNTRNPVDSYDPKESSSSVASSTAKATSAAAPTSTSAASASATPSSTPKDDDKPNTIAIAVGVVVGLLALANVNAFVNGGKLHTSNSSMNDSRLDPSFVDRRQSNGSIADNEDYSRRILKVY
jgi:cell wall integrity and stress response component